MVTRYLLKYLVTIWINLYIFFIGRSVRDAFIVGQAIINEVVITAVPYPWQVTAAFPATVILKLEK